MAAVGRQLVAGPTAEPLSLSEVKSHLRVDVADEDALISRCLVAARRWAELYTRRVLITQTWEAYYGAWPASLEVPLPPLQSVAFITWRTDGNVLNTLPAANYIVDAVAVPGRIVLAPSQVWPGDALWPVNPITVRFTAGYGDAATVPADIRAAILLLVGHLYEHREQVTEGNVLRAMPFAAEHLLMPYVAGWF